MIVRNKTNGKKFNLPKDKFQKLNNVQKQNFEVISDTDTEPLAEVQVVKNEVKTENKKIKTPPDSGEKKKENAGSTEK